MQKSRPHWSGWVWSLVGAALVMVGLVAERQQTVTRPPPLKRGLDITARARADFVIRVPEKVRPQPTDGPSGVPFWMERQVDIPVRQGRVLVAAGAPMDPFRRRLLKAAWIAGPPPSSGAFGARLALILGVFGLLGWLGAALAGSRRRLALLLALTAVSVLSGLGIKLYTDLPMACAPLALAPLLGALFAGRRAGLLAAVATAGLAGLADLATAATLVGLAAGCVAASLLTIPRRTLSLVGAAGVAGGLQAGVLLLMAPVLPPLGGELEGAALWGAAGPWAAGLGGLALAWLVLRWAQVASAGRLRRLVAPRHPLLRELRRRAPGTYRHAENVAALAEAGGRALGGDRLLLRAGAWYHDLGKLLGAELFDENRGPGPDPHAGLSPPASARRLARHVRDGLRLARRYRLPAELRTLIAEHHGTRSMGRPLARARSEGRDPDPTVYYYPGPLPSSRASAILMVCDEVEAASRQLTEPSLAAVSAVVEEVVDRLMSEYQFEDCDLTQVELVALSEALVMTLRRRLHRRVGVDQGGSEAASEAASRATTQQETK